MKGVIEEYNEISPMFPRLHVKDAEKGGPKAPPRNKMALYEQFSIPSQSFASGHGSSSLFPLPLRNCTVPTTSSYISQIGGSQSIQFSSSIAPSILSEKIQAYNSRTINFINSTKNSLKTIDGEDAFITLGSPHVKSSSCVIIQNDKDEDKTASCNLSCSLKNINILTKVLNIPEAIELRSAQYRKNHMEEEGPPPHSLDGSKSMNKEEKEEEHRFLKEESKSISVDDSLKTLQGSRNDHTQKDHADFGEKINLRDHCMEKPEVSGTKDEESCRNDDELINKPSSECGFGMVITPDDIVGFIGAAQFWKTRKTIIKHQRIFLMQVFELHRLIKVQRSLAGSPHVLHEPNFGLNKASLKMPTPMQLLSDYVTEQRKSEKANTRNIEVEKIPLPLPYISNISKGNPSNLLDYDHYLGNLALASTDRNSKQSSSIVYPSPGNQWLVPVMSPSEGLVYKPIITPYPPNACPSNAFPPNAGIMTPLYGSCNAMNFNPGNKEVLDASAIPQKISILSGSSLPQLLPPFVGSSFLHNRSISASAVEQIPENHHSFGEVNSAILYQSPSNMSSEISQVMSTRNIPSYNPTLEDKEVQISTDSSPPSKRMKGDVLPLFPVAPTFRSLSSSEDGNSQVENQSRVIKALPHNPKAASESAARIFKSIQEERKRL